MQLKATSVTKEAKQARGRTYWGIKHTDGNWYNLVVDARPNKDQVFECTVKTSESGGRTYRWAEVAQTAPASNGHSNGNGHIPWEDYEQMVRAAHFLATQIEPDQFGTEHNEARDRSQARAAIVNTVMIAFSNGKLALPKEDPDAPPPADDSDIPF